MSKEIEKLKENIETVEIHLARIQQWYRKIESLIPFTDKIVRELGEEQQGACDILIYRFTHLQDTMAAKVFPLFLEATQEQTVRLSVIDKLNLLERLGIIEDAYEWKDLRELRNHLAHDYDRSPDLQAKYLNQLCRMLPVLVQAFERIKERVAQL